jgi:hypothetical protein
MHARMFVGLRSARVVAVTAALALLALLAAPAAQAGPLLSSVSSCDNQTLSRPFLRWGDIAQYVLAPNGGAENRSRWALTGDATVTPGNESYYVRDPNDRSAIALPAGSSATTGSMCVHIDYPTLRLLVRNTGSPLSALLVEVLFEDAVGNVLSLRIGTLVGTPGWQPSPPMPVTANLLPLLPDAQTAVAFRFTPIGDGAWSIDDTYVDPWRHG